MKRYRITVSGRVQGVGFRPTVYRYALSEKLSGFVSNTANGILIEVEGEEKNIRKFLEKLKKCPPAQSKVTKIIATKIPPGFEKEFVIQKSVPGGKSLLHISPDISICDDCVKELLDKKDRRYNYPFINCTNCGPRFSIIEDIPYDRKNTTMKKFRMCGNCRSEYEKPSDRRFHTQPDACWDCGPDVALIKNAKLIKNLCSGAQAIQETIELLKKGKIVSVKSIGGFHICCDASNNKVVEKLRQRKNRPDKPFAVMMPDIKTVKKFCRVNKTEEKVLESPERPVVLLKKFAARDSILPNSIAPDNDTFGVMLPYTPLHCLLMKPFQALVMTSGNKQDEPICKNNDEAIRELSGICDYFLIHNREIFNRCDDSIVQVNKADVKIVRRSRGYVPNPIKLSPAKHQPLTVNPLRRSFSEASRQLSTILAVGAELKNTFCLTRGSEAYLSQYIGDLKEVRGYEFFKAAVKNMKNLLKVEPKVIVHDLHPNYFSTQYAQKLRTMNPELQAIPVQHHHSHIASVCAENGLDEKVIGVAFDGTGYGTDGNIWGGEFLIVDGAKFERKYHLKYIELPGGDAATHEIWRIGLSYLYRAGINTREKYPGDKSAIIRKMIDKKINCPLTSSVGRLFDAVASIINLRQKTTYEAQAAIELERLAYAGIHSAAGGYDYSISGKEIDVSKTIIGIVKDLDNKKSKSEISIKFHNTLAKIAYDVCRELRTETGINKVALSGGVFQNMILLEKTTKLLESAGFHIFTNSQVPTNDGGISLGQVWVAQKIVAARPSADKSFS